jgi:hypothetical protein
MQEIYYKGNKFSGVISVDGGERGMLYQLIVSSPPLDFEINGNHENGVLSTAAHQIQLRQHLNNSLEDLHDNDSHHSHKHSLERQSFITVYPLKSKDSTAGQNGEVEMPACPPGYGNNYTSGEICAKCTRGTYKSDSSRLALDILNMVHLLVFFSQCDLFDVFE